MYKLVLVFHLKHQDRGENLAFVFIFNESLMQVHICPQEKYYNCNEELDRRT